MIDQIGATAGEIWRHLNKNSEATIRQPVRTLDESERMVLMGIGWLAREDQLSFSTRGRSRYVSLKGASFWKHFIKRTRRLSCENSRRNQF